MRSTQFKWLKGNILQADTVLLIDVNRDNKIYNTESTECANNNKSTERPSGSMLPFIYYDKYYAYDKLHTRGNGFFIFHIIRTQLENKIMHAEVGQEKISISLAGVGRVVTLLE